MLSFEKMRNFRFRLEVSLGGSDAFVIPGFCQEKETLNKKKRNFEFEALGLSWG